MKLKVLALSLVMLAGAAVSLAQGPQMGTWKLNEAKSNVPAGSLKNTNVVYEAQGDKIKVTTDGTGTDGSPMHTEWVGKLDGKDYPLTGDPNADARAYTKVSDRVLTFVNKKPGKPSTSGRIVVAADGKTRTLTAHGTDPSGKKISSTMVYDKQ